MITTDISKMKRVKEVNTKRDEAQYELNLRRKDMAPVRPEGPYPPDTIYNPHGEYSGMDISNVKDSTVYHLRRGGKVEIVDIKDMNTKDIEYWLMRFRQARVELEGKDIPWFVNPKMRQAEIDGMKSVEKDLMDKLFAKAVSADPHEWPGSVPCGGATPEEKDAFEKDLQRRTKEEYEASAVYREQQEKEKDKMKDFLHGKDIGKKLDPEMYKEVPQVDREMNRIRCETEEFNNGIEQLFRSEAGQRAIKELQKDTEFLKILQNIVDILQTRKPDTYPEGQARYVSDAEEKFQLWLRDKKHRKQLEEKAITDRAKIGTEEEFDQFVDELDAKVLKGLPDPPGSEGVNEKDLRCKAQTTNYRKLYGRKNLVWRKDRWIYDLFAGWGERLLSTFRFTVPAKMPRPHMGDYIPPDNPKLTMFPWYDEYIAKRDSQLKAERKKRRWYRVLTVFSKVIVAVIGIFYGIIIMENILVGKPLTTYVNRVLGIE